MTAKTQATQLTGAGGFGLPATQQSQADHVPFNHMMASQAAMASQLSQPVMQPNNLIPDISLLDDYSLLGLEGTADGSTPSFFEI
jgi:hypothetical protein